MGGDNLLVVDVVNAHGLVILQTIWAPKDHLRYGRRQTRSETIRDQAHLSARLAELVPLICSASAPPAAAAHTEGSATAVADPGPAHPAAGDLAAAA